MKCRRWLALGVLCGTLCAGGWVQAAGIADLGGTFQAKGSNFPVNFDEQVTLSTTPQSVAGGQLTVRAEITPDGPNAEWVEMIYETPNGGPLAGNINAFWRADVIDVPLAVPALFDNIFFYWSEDGVAFDPIGQIPGFPLVRPNPIDAARGPVYGTGDFPPAGPIDSFDLFALLNPYSQLSNFDINPNTANGFHMAIHVSRVTAIPEPSTLAMVLPGAAIAAVAFRRRVLRLA